MLPWPYPSECRRPVLRGFVARWGIPYVKRADLLVVWNYKCVSTTPAPMLFDHDSERQIAGADAVKLIVGKTGLAFEAILPHTYAGAEAMRDVLTFNRRGISPCFTPLRTRMTEIAGRPCKVIEAATLDEFSLCADPVYLGNYCVLADGSKTKLKTELESGRLSRDVNLVHSEIIFGRTFRSKGDFGRVS